jgi:urease accessory protein
MDARGLQRLLAWNSPTLPIGAFAYSHGIETAVERSVVRCAADLGGWLAEIVTRGSGKIDAVFLVQSFRAERGGAGHALLTIAELAAAMRACAEAALESTAQGNALLEALTAGWHLPRLVAYREALRTRQCPPSYACVMGVACANAGLRERDAVLGFLHSFASNLISAGVRLIPLGQRDGLRVLASLEDTLASAAMSARAVALDDIGSVTWGVDWAMSRHETQTTRLFRS